MGLIASDSGKSFTPIPPGMHLARCYRIIDLGTQKTEWQGQIKSLPKILVQFEVHGEDDNGNPLKTSEGEPMSISKRYTLSIGDKSTLRADLASWRGRDFTPQEKQGFSLKNILGHWAMITVSKNVGKDGKEFTNIANINPVPKIIKEQGLPEGINPLVKFDIDDPDMEVFNSLSEKLQETIKSSPEWQMYHGTKTETKATDYAKASGKGALSDLDEEIPF
jgi:hypothetical protein